MAHSGDISGFAMTQFKANLEAGNHNEGISFCFELARLLAQHNQLHDLWHFQIHVRKALIDFLDNTVSVSIDLSSTNHPGKALDKLHACHAVLDLCIFTGVFDNVAYRQNLDSIPSSINIRGLAAATWKRYMRRRITAFNKKKEIDMVERFDAQYAAFLQARLRRLLATTKVFYLPLAARRALAQIQYFHLPEIQWNASAALQGLIRTKLLSIRLVSLRSACIGMSVPTVGRLRRLKPDERDKLQGCMLGEEEIKQGGTSANRRKSMFEEFVEAKEMEQRSKQEVANAEAETEQSAAAVRGGELVHDGNELIIGVDVVPEVGMKVVLRKAALQEFPELVEETGGGPGKITWVDPEDMDGDGVTGDICEVVWEKTGTKGDYRTGYEGQFRLAAVQDFRNTDLGKSEGETVVGRDVHPVEGMRVVLRESTLEKFPELIEDSQGWPGTVTWVDPEDLDGDGVTGDICEVRWDKTRATMDYRTGYEGEFRLALFRGFRFRPVGVDKVEMIVGLDVTPVEGMRVVLMASAIRRYPELLDESGGGAGRISWVDPDDQDGDGVPGDICQVVWERTGVTGDYRTGFEGEFRLALTYGREMEAAGARIQRVFRGHRERAALRTVLMAEFLRARELEHAYRRLGAAVLLQSAIRGHHSRTKLRFREVLRAYRAREEDVGADQHAPIPLKLQGVYRAHLARQDLRAVLLARMLAVQAEAAAREEQRRAAALARHRELCVITRCRLQSWFWLTKLLRRWRSVHDRIRFTLELGVQFRALEQWKQHSIDAKRRVRVARVLVDLLQRDLVVRPRGGGSLRRWAAWANWQRWLHERREAIEEGRRRRLATGVHAGITEMVARAKRLLVAAFRLRARLLFRVCTRVAREWHVTAWRRRVVRRAGDTMLPTWVEFLVYRCFRALKLSTEPGWMAGQAGDIARLKLQAAYAPVSKVTGPTLRRLVGEAPPKAQGPGLEHWEDHDSAVQERVARQMAWQLQRADAASEANEALFEVLRATKHPKLLQPRRAPSSGGTAQGRGSGAASEAGSRMGASLSSASVRVAMPRSRRRGKGGPDGASSRGRAKSAAEAEGGFWQQRTRALMEEAAGDGVRGPLLRGATAGAEVLGGSEWRVVEGATSSLLKLLLPAVHKPATARGGNPIRRAWETPSRAGAGAGGRGAADRGGLTREGGDGEGQRHSKSLPLISHRLAAS